MTFNIVCSSLVRDMNLSFEVFIAQIEKEIYSWPSNTLLGIFPEYCWRLTPYAEVLAYVEILKDNIRPDLVLVLGTIEFTINDKYTNNAIVVGSGKTYFIPKTKILKNEVKNGLAPGNNPGVIEFENFRLGVLVCADLWEPQLLNKLVLKEKADIIAVPAWTSTSRGNRNSSRLDWFSLARAVSTQYSVVVAVADHVVNGAISDVANTTIIFSPSNRQKKFPLEEFIMADAELVDIDAVAEARYRWKDKGLCPYDMNQN